VSLRVLFFLFFLFTSGRFAVLFCRVGEGSWGGSCGSFWGWGASIVDVRWCGQLVFVLCVVCLVCLPFMFFSLQFDLTSCSCIVCVLHSVGLTYCSCPALVGTSS
jgi:hypothetical protein